RTWPPLLGRQRGRPSGGDPRREGHARRGATALPDPPGRRCVPGDPGPFVAPSSSGSGSSTETGPTGPALAATQSPGLGAHTFVGRDRELAEIEALLTGATDVQLRAALDGLPGIGKTELARQVVARLARGKKFPGGIFWFNAEHADLRMQWAQFA